MERTINENQSDENLEQRAKKSVVNFQKLNPVDDIENIEIYEQALDFTLNDPEILNVAVTGPYGSGKTSVLKTYEKLKEEKSINDDTKQFMYVSLADFKNADSEEPVPLESVVEDNQIIIQDSKELRLEGKILNQIIHQVDSKKIPRTNFKLKQEVSPKKIACITIYIVLLFTLLLYLVQFNNWTEHVNSLQINKLRNILSYSTTSGFFISVLIVFFILCGIGIYTLIQRQIEDPFLKKIKVETYEIELFEKLRNTSPFDKHLDEILYIFAESGYDVFIFEDIDRYEINKLFIRLREINILLNKNRGDKIKFIYLLKDEVFESKDRTKFFDYIIPIVPVMDSSNSYDKLSEIFKKGGILKNFDPIFLKRLSLYIDDFRLLKNIYNEYLVYYAALQEINPSNDKLLALITYKNIFPNDFNDLQYKEGYVYDLFARKNSLIEQHTNVMDEEILKNKEVLESLDKEHLETIDELDALYLKPSLDYFGSRKGKVSFKTQLEYIKAVKANPTNNIGTKLDIYPVLEELKNNELYQKRRGLIEQNNSKSKNNLILKNKELEKNKRQFKSKKLKDLLTVDNIKGYFDSNINNVKNNSHFNLIRYLIRNGYIDESYQDYQTYFWESSMTREDNLFLRSITDENPQEYDYKLSYPEEIVLNLIERDFENQAIFNFDLLEYLLKSNNPYLKHFIKKIEATKNIAFVFQYLEKNHFNEDFIFILNNNWNEFIKCMLQKAFIPQESKQNYLLKTIKTVEKENLGNINVNNCITDYFSSAEELISIKGMNVEKISSLFIELDIKFKKLKMQKSEDELNEIVYQNSLYEINAFMLEQVLIYLGEGEKDIKARNYSLIYEMSDKEPLKLYIENNFELYLKINLEGFANDIINDSEEAALSIINHKDIPDDLCTDYINKIAVIIEDIMDINQELWEEIIVVDKLQLTARNLLNYYISYSNRVDSTVIRFLNMSNTFTFNFEELAEEFDAEQIKNFSNKIMKEEEINDENYSKIIIHAEEISHVNKLKHLIDSKLLIIINLKLINMNGMNLEYFRNKRSELLYEFIKSDLEEYIRIMEEEIIEDGELKRLLADINIEIEYKKHMYDLLKEKLTNLDLDYPEELQIYILDKWAGGLDIRKLVESYNDYFDKVKREIGNYAIKHNGELLKEGPVIPKELLLYLIDSDEISSNDKFKLLTPSIHCFNKTETFDYLKKLNQFLIIEVFNGSWKKIKKKDIPEAALKYYEKKEWISSFSEDKHNEEFYRVNAKLK